MRWFVWVLIAAGALAGAWPAARLLWQMETGAAEIGVVHQDGTVQRSQSGPRSFWPAWAAKPAGVRHTVRGFYAAAPGHPATGFADLSGFARAARLQTDYAAQLRKAGWEVSLYRQTVSFPDIPPRPVLLCHVIARQPGRGLMLTASDDTGEMNRLFWIGREQTVPMGAIEGPCA